MAEYSIYQCPNPVCQMRLPAESRRSSAVICPWCGSEMERKITAYRTPRVSDAASPGKAGVEIRVLLDNLRSAFNVGAVFRTADGVGVTHLYLCGITPTPDNPKVSKTALSAEFATPWSYHRNGLEAALQLKAGGARLWALEGGPAARPIVDRLPVHGKLPIVLAAGNELAGVDPEILEVCDEIVFLPMQGFKRSLNVAVATGIALYLMRYGQEVSDLSRS